MSTGEGAGPGGDARDDRQDREHRPDRISVGGGDESVTRIQLAARWVEAYAPPGDSLAQILKRFRAAYEYLDAVTHSVEPPDLDRELHDARPVAPARSAQAAAAQPTYVSSGEPAPPPPPPSAAPESRPWG
jgi:hypothetical protein